MLDPFPYHPAPSLDLIITSPLAKREAGCRRGMQKERVGVGWGGWGLDDNAVWDRVSCHTVRE